jgi:hypothetical protein
MRFGGVRLSVRSVVSAGLVVAFASPEISAEPAADAAALKAVEFQGLTDKAPITFRDMAAYAALSKLARTQKMITPALNVVLVAFGWLAPRPVAREPRPGSTFLKDEPKPLIVAGRVVDGLA